MAKADLTAQRLREVVYYSPETGDFTCIVNRGYAKVGDKTGSVNALGYVVIGIDSEVYLAHRLAWLYMTGKWPDALIDHVNREKRDNRFVNLRQANKSTNSQNLEATRTNTESGFLGVYKNKSKWAASIKLNGKRIHLGTFDTPEIAHNEYIKAKRRLHSHCAI